jgi:iron complex transport system substrate-binding protein
MKKKVHSLFSILILFALLLSACSTAQPEAPAAEVEAEPVATSAASEVSEEVSEAEPEEESQGITITDMMGREVTLDAPATSVIAIGPGALRLYVYAGNLDYVVGVEQMETGDVSGKPYMLANPDLATLPVIGQGGPNNAPDPEKILTVAPDVIFSTYSTDAAAADELQAQTGIPVVVINYGGFGVTSIFGENIQKSLMVIGQTIGDTTKAEASFAFIQQAREDLEGRTVDIADEDKPSVYVGGLGSRGAHGIESTQGTYALLDVIHANNVVDETGESGSVMIDKEKLLEWDPDYIFIDQGGYASVLEDYQNTPDFYNVLSAVKNGNLYSQLPYNYYSTNIDTAIADAYFLGKVIYPDAFADIDPAEKADEIYTGLLGVGVYEQMQEKFGGFGELTLQ